MKAQITCLILVLTLSAPACGRSQQTIKIERSPRTGGVAVPVELQPEWAGAEEGVQVTGDGGDDVVFQEAPALFQAGTDSSEDAYCAILPSDFSRGRVQEDSDVNPAFSLHEEDGRLRLLDGQQPVFAYNYGKQLREGVPERYRRSTYVHPIWDLSGTVITDDFPDDHYHHRGLSWMWPRVKVGDKTYSLWHLQGVQQIFQEWMAQDVGPVCATIGVRNAWQLSGGREIIDERVWIRAYRATDAGRAIDMRLTLEATEDTVQLMGKKTKNKGYGGVSLRLGPREETIITTSEGVQSEDSNHKRVPWADESGMFRGASQFSGAALFQHAGNPDFPAQWTLRHYGFLGVAWPGNDGTTLAPGETVTLCYRLWVHGGDAEAGRVSRAYEAFTNPPAAQIP